MSYRRYMDETKYNANGERFEVESVQVDFNGEGEVLQVEVFNAALEEWYPVDFAKMNSVDQAKVQKFVYNELTEIDANLEKKEYEPEERVYGTEF
jgi:hypothetical protein